MRLFLFFIFMTTAIVCHAQTQDRVDQITVTIEPYKQASNGAFFTFLALNCSDRRVEHIEGFDFEWGHSYKLELKRTKLAHPMEDDGDTEYQLNKILSKQAVSDSTTFTTSLVGWVQLAPNLEDDSPAFVFNEDGTCTFLDELTFECPVKFEEKIKSLNKTDGSKKGTFMFLNGKIHLVSI